MALRFFLLLTTMVGLCVSKWSQEKCLEQCASLPLPKPYLAKMCHSMCTFTGKRPGQAITGAIGTAPHHGANMTPDCWKRCLEAGHSPAQCHSMCGRKLQLSPVGGLGGNVEQGCDWTGCGINPNICCIGNRCVDCYSKKGNVNIGEAPITGNTGALGKGGKGKANIGEDGTDYSEAPMTINYDGRYFKNEKCQSVKDLGKPCGHNLCCGNGYIGFLCMPCPGNTGALGKGGKGKANIGENGMDYSDEDGKLDPTDGLRKGGNNDYELQPSANDYQECGPDCSYGGPHWGPHYPDAKLTNKLKRKISYSMYLACANAYHSGIIEPGKAVSYPRDICLLTEIQVPGCISYKSSGTSYSQFEVRYIQGDAKECQVVRV